MRNRLVSLRLNGFFMPKFEKFADYLSLEKNYSNHTVRAYVKDLTAFQVFCSSNAIEDNIARCNYSYVRRWIVEMVECGVSNRTINRKMSSLKSYYKFLLKVGEIEVSPMVKHKALKVSKKVEVPFSVKEMKVVLEEMEFEKDFSGVRDKLIIEMFYATGMRRAELLGLKLDDVDIRLALIKVLGKRNKERIIPITKSLVNSLKGYLKERERVLGEKKTDDLFITEKGVKIYEGLVYRIINLYFSKASSKLKKSPHVLRHTFATHLLNEGADLNAVKELLGHTSLAATQVYVHNSMAQLKDIYSKTHPRTKKN